MFVNVSHPHLLCADVPVHSVCGGGRGRRSVQSGCGGAGFAERTPVQSSADLGNTLQRQVTRAGLGLWCRWLPRFWSLMKLSCRRDSNYLTDSTWWGTCTEPKNVVQFNIGLFGTLLATSCLQLILCAIQMINGLFGCLCGTCVEKGVGRNLNSQPCLILPAEKLNPGLWCSFLTAAVSPWQLTGAPCWRLRAAFLAAPKHNFQFQVVSIGHRIYIFDVYIIMPCTILI